MNTDQPCLLHAVEATQIIRKALEQPRHYADPTITLRECLIDRLEHLIYREGWHTSWRYKVILWSFKLIK